MQSRMMTAIVLALCVGSQAADLAACGDKFLIAARGTRFQRAGLVRRPATVLVFAATNGRFAASVERLDVAAALVKVGYTPTVVTERDAFERALGQRAFDLVLADLADSDVVMGASKSGRAPAVVVVAYDTPGDTMARARRAHDGVVKNPGRVRAVVDAVDDVLFARALRPAANVKASN